MSRAPAPRDLPRIEEQLQRFARAMLLCFTAAVLLLVFVVNARGNLAPDVLQQLASLGVAFWLVGFVLVFFVAWLRLKRQLATSVD